ncbi:hypothetical protein [Mycolicibacterium aichiense]|uniref:Uncharacterized protein n=1 Tax=Mycolicibacterium aichiense TaxID=1799 RepID=A0AAD1HQD3_9MYCO|nr:hypothetical protein [Mycolicibacterium aichiense]MCV7017492.1 hypothetical protein [Mycolicibacterium aichiense]BBX09041.1 hypothetical protein MAIC_38440 [Mycolicibacterium aichiense]STZ82832.1 Uncharacterised protein [Mycolicibacterium aichiense]
MRTAVVRVDVDPAGELTPAQLTEGVAALRKLAEDSGVTVVDNNLAAMPRGRREAELLISNATEADLTGVGVTLCARAFGTEPVIGVVTYVSRGTDEDAHGVLAGFGLRGEIARTEGDDGYDILDVSLSKADMARIPESRVHTALEASTNCEIRIRLV